MTEDKLSRVKKYKTEEIKTIQISNDENNEDEEHINSHPIITKILLYLIIIIISIVLYSVLIAPYFIDIKEYKVESSELPNSFNGIKIIQFSDIHYGNSINKSQLDKIVTKINEQKPDIILFTGDLISKDVELKEEDITNIKESLKKLECTMYKYAIYGDEDNNKFEEIMNESNFIILNNSSKLLYYKNNNPIVISGLGPSNNQNYSILNSAVDEIDIMSYFKIVLVHEPDTIDNILSYSPNIIMSGHTLGGSIKLPYLKPLFLPPNGQKYYEDYYKINKTDIYISNGLGTSSLSARLNNHPSINLYRLYTPKES